MCGTSESGEPVFMVSTPAASIDGPSSCPAQEYTRTVEEETKTCSGMTFTFRKQLWTLHPPLDGDDLADATLNAESMVEQLQDIMSAEYADTTVNLEGLKQWQVITSTEYADTAVEFEGLKHCGGNDYTAVYILEGTQLPSHKVAASSARLFARNITDEDDYSRPIELDGPFDLRNYKTAERVPFDDSNIVLVPMTPWDDKVNEFATQQFKREIRGTVVAASHCRSPSVGCEADLRAGPSVPHYAAHGRAPRVD